jgi:hypothetical protein
LIFTYLEDINVVDAPLLEKILHWSTSGGYRPNLRRGMTCRSTISIGHAPNLRTIGYL